MAADGALKPNEKCLAAILDGRWRTITDVALLAKVKEPVTQEALEILADLGFVIADRVQHLKIYKIAVEPGR